MWLQAAAFLALHRILRHIEADPEGAVLGRLPQVVQQWIRWNLKAVLDPLADVGARFLPLMQPSILKDLQPTLVPYDSTAELAVFRTPLHSTSAPLFCFVHGGIWCLGSWRQYVAMGQRLASEGFVAVIIGYTTWPEADAAAQVRQVRRAVTYAKAHAEDWGANPQKVFLSGQSSGANVAALALLGSSPDVPRCTGYIGMAGVYNIETHYMYEKQRGVDRISPMAAACKPFSEHSPTRIAAQTRGPLACDRVLILHGEKDHTVPVSGAAMFALQLQKNEQEVELIITLHDNHTSFLTDMMLGRECQMLEAIIQFCNDDGKGPLPSKHMHRNAKL